MADSQKPKRRLKKLQVDEISLVANPAVPDATFVIAKRLQTGKVAKGVAALRDTVRRQDESLSRLEREVRGGQPTVGDVLGRMRALEAAKALSRQVDRIGEKLAALEQTASKALGRPLRR